MRVEVSGSSFCPGCEFAGDIPEGSILDQSMMCEDGPNINFIVDGELRVSKGIIDPNEPYDTEAAGKIIELVDDCDRECGSCALEGAGYVPVQVSTEEKAAAVKLAVNGKEGVLILGQEAYVVDPPQKNEGEV